MLRHPTLFFRMKFRFGYETVRSTKTKRIRALKEVRIFVPGGNHADFDESCGNSLFSVSDQRC
jgi:hypothetical protein